MAHKKGAGSSKNGRESQSKRLGVKIFGGQAIIEGRPPVVILNGKQLKIGDVIDPGLEILDISLREVTFAFRGVELTRKF